MNDLLAKFFEVHKNSITNWRREGKPALKFVEKYLNEEDIKQFLKSGVVNKFEDKKYKNIQFEPIKQYFHHINYQYVSVGMWYDYAYMHYFSFLKFYLNQELYKYSVYPNKFFVCYADFCNSKDFQKIETKGLDRYIYPMLNHLDTIPLLFNFLHSVLNCETTIQNLKDELDLKYLKEFEFHLENIM